MAEGARLESVYTFTRIEGSNPSLTARIQKRPNRFDLGLFSLYTTNFTEPLSYQGSAFLKLPKFP